MYDAPASEPKVRMFPFGPGDKIRLTCWDPQDHVQISTFGDVFIIAKNRNGVEDTFFKDASTAYHDTWEAYSPNPGESEVFIEYRMEGGAVNQYLTYDAPSPESLIRLPRGSSIWKVRITPIERIHP